MLLIDWRKRFNDKSDLQKLFTLKELQLFPDRATEGSLAGRYIIKNLIFRHLKYEGDFKQIEILNDDFGKPLLGMSDQLKELCQNMGMQSISCSISHSRKRVVGMIVIEN
jgi:holo-[acyl-carrier-protein] synthase